MYKRGTRVDDLTVEGKPGYYRVIRFGIFSQSEPSAEITVDRKGLEDLLANPEKLRDIFPDLHEKDLVSFIRQMTEHINP